MAFLSRLLKGFKAKFGPAPKLAKVSVARVSPKLIETLLTQDDAFGAVSQLAGYWEHRIREDEPQFALTLPEYYCQLVRTYIGYTVDSGHFYYLSGPDAAYVDETIIALRATGFEEIADILESVAPIAGKLNPEIPKEEAELAARADPLDQPIMELAEEEGRKLQAYLRAHSDQILRAERGWPPQ